MRVLVALAVLVTGVAALGVFAEPVWESSQPRPNVEPASTALLPRIALPSPAEPQQDVLGAALSRSRLNSSAVRRLLANAVDDPSLGGSVGVEVEKLGAQGPLVRVGGRHTVTPASLLKLLPVAAALTVLGPDHRFETSVVQGAQPSNVVLVGGGDPLLSAQPPVRPSAGSGMYPYPRPASLAALARRTARHLTRAAVYRVQLRYDASLFSGPAVNPTWRRSYVRDDEVSPISALWVDEGRVRAGYPARVQRPAAAAAQRFADLLRRQGVEVSGPIRPDQAGAKAPFVARVRSAPLAEIVQHTIELSDNEAAEVLLRQVAVATGHSGTSRAGVRAVTKTLQGIGLDFSGAHFYDGSGLSRADAVPVDLLVDVLQAAADPAHPELRPLVSALPVAGFTGSLAYRFTSDARDGLGVVRAKTGTLTGVHGLAGIVATAQGQPLVFAVVADAVPVRRTLAAQATLDHIAGLLAACGCRP